jgi:tRNA A-37 threonylcarbamoyl transferase component Bud32
VVYLVRQDAPAGGLLRLKTWRHRAPDEFLARFSALKEGLDACSEASIVSPLAASVDEAGRPLVLSHFRRGVPVIVAANSRALSTEAAKRLLRAMDSLLQRVHRRGLAHGSLVPGNVMVQPDGDWFLVDFGMSALVSVAPHPAGLAARDLAGLATLSGVLTASPASGLQPPV